MKIRASLFCLSAISVFGLLSFNISSEKGYLQVYNHNEIVEFSANPPAKKTGAPGESTCTSCHSGSILSAAGVVNFEFNVAGSSTEYTPGETYPMQISIGSGSKSGFELTILNGNNQKAGDFINGVNTSTTVASGKEYIRHSASNNLTSFNFEWTAPSSNMGDLRAFFSFCKSNVNGLNSGDLIYVGDVLIPTGVPLSNSKIDENPNQIKLFWDASTKQIHLNYELMENSELMINIQSLNGQLIQSTTLGKQYSGNYHQVIAGGDVIPGLYLVSVFIGNRVFNQKMLLN